MNLIERDQLHRTAKIALDQGLVADVNSARAYLENLVLQIHVGPDLHEDLSGQAALLTAINAGGRAMLGGVRGGDRGQPHALAAVGARDRISPPRSKRSAAVLSIPTRPSIQSS